MHDSSGFSSELRASAAVQPVYIRDMFAWLHRPQPYWGGETAVLICPGLYNDALASHRFLRVLADGFAAAGYPALRFDYPGTGDSCDLAAFPEAGGNHWHAWQQSVHAAADYLLAETGARRLIIVGLRIGATLAALAAEQRPELAGLVLLAPVTRGQSYIRQLWVQSGLLNGETTKLQEGFTFQEIGFSAGAVQAITQVDLRKVRLPAGTHVAICAQSPSAPLTACEAAWQAQGVVLSSMDFTGLEGMLSQPLEEAIPPVNLSKILSWAERNIPACPILQPAVTPVPVIRLQRAGYVETPINFGPGAGLFGMLCQPEAGEPDIAVLLCGGGRNPHYGVGRSAVHLARSLAEAGMASLRIDYLGIGDSVAPAGGEMTMTDPFDNRTTDIKAAIFRLEALGYRRFAVQGLCSGAFHAFHAALADPRIGMVLLVNLPFFEETDDPCQIRTALPWYHYLGRLAHPRSWGGMLSGRYDIAAILKNQVHSIGGKLRRLGSGKPATENFARAAVATLSQRDVQITLLFGPNETGFFDVERHFGLNGNRLKKCRNVTLKVFDKFEHSMATLETQELGDRFMIEKLTAWEPAPAAA